MLESDFPRHRLLRSKVRIAGQNAPCSLPKLSRSDAGIEVFEEWKLKIVSEIHEQDARGPNGRGKAQARAELIFELRSRSSLQHLLEFFSCDRDELDNWPFRRRVQKVPPQTKIQIRS